LAQSTISSSPYLTSPLFSSNFFPYGEPTELRNHGHIISDRGLFFPFSASMLLLSLGLSLSSPTQWHSKRVCGSTAATAVVGIKITIAAAGVASFSKFITIENPFSCEATPQRVPGRPKQALASCFLLLASLV